MDAKRHHRAVADRAAGDRLDAMCEGLNATQKTLARHAKPHGHSKIVVEYDLHDGYVETVRLTETRIVKIPRQKAA